MAKRSFAHPSGNGYVETVDPVLCVVGFALLGVVFLLIKRAWGAALVAVPVQAVLLGLAFAIAGGDGGAFAAVWFAGNLALGWVMAPAIAGGYLKRGWKEIATAGR